MSLSGYRRTFRTRLLDDGSTFTVTYWKPEGVPAVLPSVKGVKVVAEAVESIRKVRPEARRKLPKKRGKSVCTHTGKLRYGDQLAAERALAAALTSSSRRRLEFRAYQCPFCGMWHLTSKPKRERRAS